MSMLDYLYFPFCYFFDSFQYQDSCNKTNILFSKHNSKLRERDVNNEHILKLSTNSVQKAYLI